MAALTDNKEIPQKSQTLINYKVGGDTVIFKGAIVKIGAAGYLNPMAAEADAHLAGIAYEKKDNTGGAAGDLECRVLTEGLFLLTSSGLAQSDVGSVVYASDDQTVSTTQGANEIAVGRIEEVVSPTSCYVRLGL